MNEKNENPLFSIITVCYNSEKYIRDTIESLLNQTYDNIEYVIVDGKSTDNTIDIIKEYEPKFNGRMKWVSEPDEGIYDAMNKGIKMSTGDIIGFLNSDDFYIKNNSIEIIKKEFKSSTEIDACYCNVAYVDRNNTKSITRIWGESNQQFFSKCQFGWVPCHPSFFAKSQAYKKIGGFDTDLSIAADFDLLCRFLKNKKINIKYVNETLIKMRENGFSNNGLMPIIKGNIESFKALRNNGIFPYFIFLKPFRKILQKLKSF